MLQIYGFGATYSIGGLVPEGLFDYFWSLQKRRINIIGAGAAGLFLAAALDPEKFEVQVFEQNAAAGRKLLVAGDGGLNFTHSENAEVFLTRYIPSSFITEAFLKFDNQCMVSWFKSIGISSFKGSSGRMFPSKGIKPIQVLNAMLKVIEKNEVRFHFRCPWKGFRGNIPVFGGHCADHEITSGATTVFALGGASWPVTGSTGHWTSYFAGNGISVVPFSSANCRVLIHWPEQFAQKHKGNALKNIRLEVDSENNLGELMISADGLEGSGLYPLVPGLRRQLQLNKVARLWIDLKPSVSEKDLVKKLKDRSAGRALTRQLRDELSLSPAQVSLIKAMSPKDMFTSEERLSAFIKHIPVEVHALGPVTDAISTVGGISLSEIDGNFQLKKIPGCYTIGEMLDYDAPTGGYLLQSCFSMARFVADHLNSR